MIIAAWDPSANPANICLGEEVLKTSSAQDFLSSKTSSRFFQDVFTRRFIEDVFQARPEDVLEDEKLLCWKRLEMFAGKH